MKPENSSPPQAIQLAAADNVAVARQDLAPGSTVRLNGRAVTVTEPIASGHKLALAAIARGAAVLKYGQGIG
ncbi:MAG: SAF domain-containing protein, partial [Comamonas sp.]